MRHLLWVMPCAAGLACAGLLVATNQLTAESNNNAAAAELEPSVELPIGRAVLFNSGVGYFQREGFVTDEHGREPDVPELRDLPRDVRADLGRERLPVHHGRRHARDGTHVPVRKSARGPQVTTCNLLSLPPA